MWERESGDQGNGGNGETGGTGIRGGTTDEINGLTVVTRERKLWQGKNPTLKEEGIVRRISIRSRAFGLPLGLALVLAAIGITGSARADTSQATIAGYAYAPNPITVSVGSTITWTNQDPVTHTVTSDSGVFDSGGISSGGTFSQQFNQAGTFTYHCSIHRFIKGTIIVQQAASSPTASSTTTTLANTATSVPSTPTLVPVTPTTVPTTGKTPKASKKAFLAMRVGVTYRYRPTQIKVKVGSKVTWKNASDAEHTVTSRTKGWKLNKLLKTKKSLSFVFHKTGTFKFHCRFHPGMVGKVIVHK